jgi:thiol-disulfide isomerase/thioredoxin
MIIFLLILLCSCDNTNQVNERTKNNNISNSEVTENNLDEFKSDTLLFESLTSLMDYYRQQTDSIERLKVNFIARNILNSNSNADSIHILRSFSDSMINERNNSIYKFVVTHPNNSESFNGLKYFVLDRRIPISFLDSLFHQFPANLQSSKEGEWLSNQIDKRKKTETQSEYNTAILNFKFYDIEGKAIALKNISSKYLLLDFWASWCTPCRYENRKLVIDKNLIENMADISIVAISLDENKDKWIQASKADNLNYLNVCDFQGLESQIAKELQITTIPYNVLIMKDGKILANNLWDNNLKNFIKSLQ